MPVDFSKLISRTENLFQTFLQKSEKKIFFARITAVQNSIGWTYNTVYKPWVSTVLKPLVTHFINLLSQYINLGGLLHSILDILLENLVPLPSITRVSNLNELSRGITTSCGIIWKAFCAYRATCHKFTLQGITFCHKQSTFRPKFK